MFALQQGRRLMRRVSLSGVASIGQIKLSMAPNDVAATAKIHVLNRDGPVESAMPSILYHPAMAGC